jgi:hypothetical protein
MKIERFSVLAAVSLGDYKKVAPNSSLFKVYHRMYSELFGEKQLRIAFKLHSAYDSNNTNSSATAFKLDPRVQNYLESVGYSINETNPRQAKWKGSNKFSEITKILAKQKDDLSKELLIIFNRENQKFLKDDSVPVWCVLSRYARDYLGQSYSKSWDNCKNFKTGQNLGYLRTELQSGYLCAYFIRTHLNMNQLCRTAGKSMEKRLLALIDESLGRLLIVPYRYGPIQADKPDANIILMPALATYGFVPTSAKKELRTFLDKNYNEKVVVEKEKSLKVFVAPGYSDSNPTQDYWGVTKENIGSLNDEELYVAIKNHPENIRLLLSANNSESVNHILRQVPMAIEYLSSEKYLTEKQMRTAVDSNSLAIRFIAHRASEDIQRLSVEDNGRNIKFIPNPSEEIQLVAVSQNGFALKYLANPSEQVIMEALNQNGNAIKFVENPNQKMISRARKQAGKDVDLVHKIGSPDFKDSYGEPDFPGTQN